MSATWRSSHETPADVPVDSAPPKNTLKALVRKMLAEGRTVLTEEESKKFLINYRIPTTRTYVAASAEEAVSIARTRAIRSSLKIVSPDISYKSDAGGVVLGIRSEEELRDEYLKMMDRVRAFCPERTIKGVTVQKMVEKIDYEVILGAKKDEDFGSVILFGMGGIGVQIFQDFSIGLPPLNQALARKLMEETRVYRLLQGYRGKPPANLAKLEQIILSFSKPHLGFPRDRRDGYQSHSPRRRQGHRPRCTDHTGRRITRFVVPSPPDHQPLPHEVCDALDSSGREDVLLRPIRPEDEPLEHEMLTSLSEKTLKERFFQVIKQITHEMHVRLCNIDYEREIAIVAEIRKAISGG